MSRHRRLLVAALSVALLIAALPSVLVAQEGEVRIGFRPDAPPYAVRGEHPVGVMDFVLEDEARPLIGQIWYPALNPDGAEEMVVYDLGYGDVMPPPLNFQDGHAIMDAAFAVEGGPYPLIVSSHGGGGAHFYTAYLHEHLASQGFVVMAFLHPGGSIVDAMAAQNEEQQLTFAEAQVDALVLRVVDISRAIDYAEVLTAPDGLMAGLIDTERVGVTGISFGGYAALAASGGRLHLGALTKYCEAGIHTSMMVSGMCTRAGGVFTERDAALRALAGVEGAAGELWPSIGDPRIDASAPIVPQTVVFGDDGLADVRVPTMILAGSADNMVAYQYNALPAYENLGADDKAFVVFENAGHTFAGYCSDAVAGMMWGVCSDPVWDTARTHDLTDHFITAFMRAQLYGDAEAAAALTPEAVTFPGIRYETTMMD